MASTTTVKLDIADDRTAVVTLDRPHAGNSVDGVLRDELNAIWAEVRERRDLRSVVLTGAGDRFFCTGIDVDFNLNRTDPSPTGFTWPDITGVWKPVVAAVNGACCGGGLHFIYQSDFAIAGANASFFEPHVSIGIVPVREVLGAATRMPLGAVARMAFVGRDERIDAEEAYRLGLVTEVVPQGDLLDRSLAVCSKINQQSPEAVRAVKEILQKSHGLNYVQTQNIRWADTLRDQVHGSDDYIEGHKAFLEKRPPQWTDGT